MSVWISRGSPKQTVTLRISLDGIYNVKWDVTGPALEANIPSIIENDTD